VWPIDITLSVLLENYREKRGPEKSSDAKTGEYIMSVNRYATHPLAFVF
jgi:hypothetical protein